MTRESFNNPLLSAFIDVLIWADANKNEVELNRAFSEYMALLQGEGHEEIRAALKNMVAEVTESLLNECISKVHGGFYEWYICDYTFSDGGTVCGEYLRNNTSVPELARTMVNALRQAHLSVYEVTSVHKNGLLWIRDVIKDGKPISLRDMRIAINVKNGDLISLRTYQYHDHYLALGWCVTYSTGLNAHSFRESLDLYIGYNGLKYTDRIIAPFLAYAYMMPDKLLGYSETKMH